MRSRGINVLRQWISFESSNRSHDVIYTDTNKRVVRLERRDTIFRVLLIILILLLSEILVTSPFLNSKFLQ